MFFLFKNIIILIPHNSLFCLKNSAIITKKNNIAEVPSIIKLLNPMSQAMELLKLWLCVDCFSEKGQTFIR